MLHQRLVPNRNVQPLACRSIITSCHFEREAYFRTVLILLRSLGIYCCLIPLIE
ncbi:hypothetical protein BDQ12DRAFT_693354 [Crucibulum laeve]|uniref:Uncharacterized protein n=1 Tax=Crucibulum laeve TaxID=68775 RepID=A0A5C3LI77_9AGAR|nr:hypothetical protein BDQ12DRAFT_693354 [Crucibulum laeve]